MQHSWKTEGFGIRIRPVRLDDAAFIVWLRGLEHKWEHVAVIGHEPDISRMIAGVIAGGELNIEVKKGACLEVDCNRIGRGEFTLLFPPWAAKK